MKIIYLAGKITGDPDYRSKFCFASRMLTNAGFTVINPSTLPDGLSYAAYIRLSTAMLDECEGICLLTGWIDSPGARHEHNRAEICGLRIFYFEEWLREKVVDKWLA